MSPAHSVLRVCSTSSVADVPLGSLVWCLPHGAAEGGPSHPGTPRAGHWSESPGPGRRACSRWVAVPWSLVPVRCGRARSRQEAARRLASTRGRLTPEREKPRLGRVFHHAPKRTRTSTGRSEETTKPGLRSIALSIRAYLAAQRVQFATATQWVALLSQNPPKSPDRSPTGPSPRAAERLRTSRRPVPAAQTRPRGRLRSLAAWTRRPSR
jgi:hypothetical protein